MCFRKIKSFFKKKASREERYPEMEQETEPDNQEQENINPSTMSTNSADPREASAENYPEFDFLENLIRYRLDKYFPADHTPEKWPAFDVNAWRLPLKKFVLDNNLSANEAITLLIGLVPHIRPHLFDKAIQSKLPVKDPPVVFPHIGGVRGNNSRFFLPTGETVLFLLADVDLDKRLPLRQLFGAEHIFWERKIIWLEDMQNAEPSMNGKLILSPDYIDLLTYGTHHSPQFSISFPARKIAPVKQDASGNYIKTPPSFNDLVIPEELTGQIGELKSWLRFNNKLMNEYGMKDKLKNGYRTLFYGPPGTGKTYTAEILGNDLQKEVFKIDLSMIVSKYIGETEKNLELLFARAEDKGWILFFDEADALFGKRTAVKEAHDKYANQEVSFLLQRIEDYNGLVILATNMKNNIDDAFLRRFNSILKFPFPDSSQRALIWKKSLPANAVFKRKIVTGSPAEIKEEEVDIPELVKKYELTGGNIINVIHYAGIKALENLEETEKTESRKLAELIIANAGKIDDPFIDQPDSSQPPKLTIYLSDVLDGIKREMIKEGKPFSA